MRKYFYKTQLFEISKRLLFLLIVSINLREPIFHSRELLFFLFIMISFRYGDYKKLINALLLLAIWAFTLIYNVIFPGSNAINGTFFQGVIISAYLFLMVFSNKEYQNTIIRAFIVSATIVSLITIFLWLVCWFVPPIGTFLKAYFNLLYEKTNLTFINIDSRAILGIHFFFVWYRTIPIVIPALGFFYIRRLKGEKTKKNLFYIIIYSAALILSGTRADMLVTAMLLFFYIAFYLIKKRLPFLAISITLIGLSIGVLAASLFLHDKGSQSSSIKHLHQVSYFNTFESDFVRTVLFGWGQGSTFYTLGRNEFVDVTELSHWETIRRYGFVSFCLIMIGIWLKPLIKKIINEKGILKNFYAVVVFAFIFVACTNPYLLDSLGFCVLLFFDAWFESDKRKRKFKCQLVSQ